MVLVRGDSGSWVIDPIDGELYGHLVAGDPLTGCAYMIPAFKVFEDLEKKFGQVTLPTRNNMAEFLTGTNLAYRMRERPKGANLATMAEEYR
jgi:hypothetical protein